MNAGWIAGGVFTLLGGLIAFWGLRIMALDRAIGRWPRAPGRILASSIDSESGTYRDQQGYDVESTTYVLKAKYEYEVNGQKYIGTKVCRAPMPTNNYDKVKQSLDRYPINGKIGVLYDPRSPETAYLETRVSVGAIFLVSFGVFFLLMGLGAIAIGIAVTTGGSTKSP